MSETRPAARDRILDAAAELLYERGYHAVGIDLVIERAGVAKATLYRHFPTKDDLVVAWLRRADQGFTTWLDAALAAAPTPGAALSAYLDALEVLATSPTCLGCTFQVASAEFPDPDHPGHAEAAQHKRALRGRLRALAVDAGAADPDGLADGLLLLTDGAFAAARMFGPDSPARHVSTAGRALLAGHGIDAAG